MFSKPATTLNDCSSTSTGMLRKLIDKMTTFISTNQVPISKTHAGQLTASQYTERTEMDYITENPMYIRIHRATNGFIVQTATFEGARALVHIATTMEEVHNIITTQLVTKKMEGK